MGVQATALQSLAPQNTGIFTALGCVWGSHLPTSPQPDISCSIQTVPVTVEGAPVSERPFTRTGLLGFIGPVSMSSRTRMALGWARRG